MLSVRIFFVVFEYNIGGSEVYFSTYTKVKRVDIVRNFAPDKKQNPNLC